MLRLQSVSYQVFDINKKTNLDTGFYHSTLPLPIRQYRKIEDEKKG